MKKISLFLILAVCIILTGCGQKKLICTYSSSDSYYGSDDIKAKYLFKKDNTISKYIIDETVTYNDAYLKNNNTTVDAQYQNALTYCKESIPANKNIECKVTKYKNTVTVKLVYNISKMSKEDIESINFTEYVTYKYDDIKDQYSSQGFACK